MAQLKHTRFSEYELTTDEARSGRTLNQMQQMVLQNQISEISKQILALEALPESYATFIQQDAYLKGQLAILQFLLDDSEAALAEMLDDSEEQR